MTRAGVKQKTPKPPKEFGIFDMVVSILAMLLPVAGLVFMITWSLSRGENPKRQLLARWFFIVFASSFAIIALAYYVIVNLRIAAAF